MLHRRGSSLRRQTRARSKRFGDFFFFSKYSFIRLIAFYVTGGRVAEQISTRWERFFECVGSKLGFGDPDFWKMGFLSLHLLKPRSWNTNSCHHSPRAMEISCKANYFLPKAIFFLSSGTICLVDISWIYWNAFFQTRMSISIMFTRSCSVRSSSQWSSLRFVYGRPVATQDRELENIRDEKYNNGLEDLFPIGSN